MKSKSKSDKPTEESWGNLDPTLKASLERGLAQSERGEVIPHEEVMAYIRDKYLKKPINPASKKIKLK
jgi:hypothetical protein